MHELKVLPTQLYRADQTRALDRCAIDEFGIPGISLMRHAGQVAFEQLLARWPEVKQLTIFCGGGNNGGDGYIIAGLAHDRGLQVQLVQLAATEKLKGDALQACRWARQCGVTFIPFSDELTVTGDVIVDALLGTGLEQAVRGQFVAAIETINTCAVPVLAVDIPSGLNSDTGCVMGAAVWAELTVSFIGLKQGMFTAAGPSYCGDIVFDDLGVPAAAYKNVTPAAHRIDAGCLAQAFPPRQRDAHKGHFGHVLVVGGHRGYGGAAMMAGQAAGRVGAGLVSVATHPDHVAPLLARCPEIMAHGVESGEMLKPLLADKTVIVIGPGLGQDDWSRQLLKLVLASEVPLVVDADGLNLLVAQTGEPVRRDNWVLTPHPGEAARLLGCSTAQVQADRFAAAKTLQQQYGGVVLLKGNGTLVAGAQTMTLCCGGNPGMASGGMGDVLSGVLGGLLAQGFELERAVTVGAALHAEAADWAAEAGERGMQATDLLPFLRELVNPF